jgi:hypothetical protein
MRQRKWQFSKVLPLTSSRVRKPTFVRHPANPLAVPAVRPSAPTARSGRRGACGGRPVQGRRFAVGLPRATGFARILGASYAVPAQRRRPRRISSSAGSVAPTVLTGSVAPTSSGCFRGVTGLGAGAAGFAVAGSAPTSSVAPTGADRLNGLSGAHADRLCAHPGASLRRVVGSGAGRFCAAGSPVKFASILRRSAGPYAGRCSGPRSGRGRTSLGLVP